MFTFGKLELEEGLGTCVLNCVKPIELFQLCELCRAAFTAFTTGKQELSSYLNIYIHISLSAFMMQL